MGGLSAFIMSLLIRLAPRQKISFSIEANPKALQDLIEIIRSHAKALAMDETETSRMELACEETFMHLLSEQKGQGGTVMFKIVRVEQGLFTEAIIGGSVNDVVNLTPPRNLITADDDELSSLGILLLGKLVKEIKHIKISGVNYLSFIA